ncbi:MAG: sensor histidine kinase [Actinomycetota bacterium]|nr:sensor histidine kinase [Actinomycetota bacterium]MDQ2955931.1 sensor histidine kinase [Actinomycetota bacterium]
MDGPTLGTWSRARSWAVAHPTLLDTALVVLLELWVVDSLRFIGDRDWWQIPLSQLLILPLILRRRYPSAVFGLVAVAAGIQWLAQVRFAADAALLVALYTVAVHQSRHRALVAAGVLEVGVVLAAIRFAPSGDGIIASMIFLTGLVAAALFGGITLQTRRQYLASLVERAVRLEHERDQQRRLAATEERSRIARELHDVIAHSLSVVITLADAAALANASYPEQATEAMRQVAATGRSSMTEMRRLLGVLREDEPGLQIEFAPQPDLASLDGLVADVRAAGLPARLSVTGLPQALPPTAQSAVYRIVQESLTNALKHAHDPSQVRVEIRWRADEIQIDVADDGSATILVPANGDVGTELAGHGLIGMRERAALFDGTVDAGPTELGGWRVRAILPAQHPA